MARTRVIALSRKHAHMLVLSVAGTGACVAALASSTPSQADLPQSQGEGKWIDIRAAKDVLRTVSTGVLPGYKAGGDHAGGSILAGVVQVLADLSAEAYYRDLLPLIGGPYLVDWLLKLATEEPESMQQAHAEATVVKLLNNDSTAAAVIQRPGAVPRLLQLAVTSADGQTLIRTLDTALAAMRPNKAVAVHDIETMLKFLQSEHDMELKRVAAAYLASWTESSVVNSHTVASSGGVNTVSEVLRQVTGMGSESHLLQCEVARIMGALATNCANDAMGMESWVNPLVYMLADAAATSDVFLAQPVVDALTACVTSGNPRVREALAGSTLWPLLHTIAKEGCGQFKCAAVPVVGALASGSVPMPENEEDFWTETLLGWVTGNGANDCLAAASSATLSDMASVSGPRGLKVARWWLSELLITLSEASKLQISAELPWKEEKPIQSRSNGDLVAPTYARYIAAEVRGLLGQSEADYCEPPDHSDGSMKPQWHTESPFVDGIEEEGEKGTPTSRALKIVCDIAVAEGSFWQKWLVSAGVFALLKRLVQEQQAAGQDSDPVDTSVPRTVEQQAARLLALLSHSRKARQHIRECGFAPWLEERVTSEDPALSSCAARTLLHLEGDQFKGCWDGTCVARDKLPVFSDGIDLFNPQAKHHRMLARGMDKTKGTPLLDIVFVHGIHGGPFVTWRVEGMGRTCNVSWPMRWLSNDVPEARTLSVGYPAPVSGWEGGSVPFRETAHHLLDKLLDAGVGKRPVIFIAHSMGGILVKEMLAYARKCPSSKSELLENTTGLVFYSTPHYGSWLADVGWTLRHVGASPAPSIQLLKPGLYLMELNRKIGEWHKERRLPVLNFAEGQPTRMLNFVPRLLIVPPESADPGFGEVLTLPEVDHVSSCKPSSREDPAYSRTLEFILAVANDIRRS